MRRLLPAAVIAATVCATALAAPARNVDLLKAFARDLPRVKRATTVPVLLPPALPLGGTYRLYRAFSCGGSCSPTSFWFAHGGVLYSWQVKDLPRGAKAILVRLAEQAVAAGPR